MRRSRPSHQPCIVPFTDTYETVGVKDTMSTAPMLMTARDLRRKAQRLEKYGLEASSWACGAWWAGGDGVSREQAN